MSGSGPRSVLAYAGPTRLPGNSVPTDAPASNERTISVGILEPGRIGRPRSTAMEGDCRAIVRVVLRGSCCCSKDRRTTQKGEYPLYVGTGVRETVNQCCSSKGVVWLCSRDYRTMYDSVFERLPSNAKKGGVLPSLGNKQRRYW